MKIESRIVPIAPTPPPEREIILTLTENEAFKLRALTYNGNDVRSRVLDAVARATNMAHYAIDRIPMDRFLDELRLALVDHRIDIL